MAYEHLLVEEQHLGAEAGVALVRLNRPKELNALNTKLMTELAEVITTLDNDEAVRCIVLTGNERAFAAGADIKELSGATQVDIIKMNRFARWEAIRKCRKPIVAAVSGFVLGGGCELSMLCDIVVASETAQFGQPEIKIGVIPGAGGTQRLTHALGKSRAMELLLTGRFIDAQEAKTKGLVSHVVPVELYLDTALELAREIASMPPLAVQMAKDAVNHAYELGLSQGVDYERHNFYLLIGKDDHKEGMAAFIEKRKPNWTGQ